MPSCHMSGGPKRAKLGALYAVKLGGRLSLLAVVKFILSSGCNVIKHPTDKGKENWVFVEQASYHGKNLIKRGVAAEKLDD